MYIPPINVPQIAAPAVVRDGSKFNAIASSISNIFSSAAPIIQAVIPNRGINPGAGVPYYPLPSSGGMAPPPPPVVEKKGSVLKIVGIAAGVALLAFGGYKLATRKKKGLSGVGCPEPEKPAALAGVKKAHKRKKSRKAKKVKI